MSSDPSQQLSAWSSVTVAQPWLSAREQEEVCDGCAFEDSDSTGESHLKIAAKLIVTNVTRLPRQWAEQEGN